MKKQLLVGLTTGLLLVFALGGVAFALPLQDFEDGLLDGWQVGGRQISGSGNWWGVTAYAGSQMAYLHHNSFTELTLSRTFTYSPGTVLSFDALFSINGDTSPSASGSSNFYSMDSYSIWLYNASDGFLGGRSYGAATTTFPYDVNPTIIEFWPNGLQHYEHDIALLASELGVAIGDVGTFTLSFGGYSSWWSGDDMVILFDNVGSPNSPSVPEPATILLFGAGILGLAGTRLRRKKQ